MIEGGGSDAAPAGSPTGGVLAPRSDRARLAALALTTALRHRHVAGAGASPEVTAQAVAEPDGTYEVTLLLRANLAPLGKLADELRAQIATAAARFGLAEKLGRIEIVFTDLEEASPAERIS